VYAAEAVNTPSLSPPAALAHPIWGNCSVAGACIGNHGRRVALKRFHKCGSRTFKKELAALERVGIHPNILRVLESYENCDGEDVLVLEYCDGSTLYDLYAREHSNGGLPERLIAKMLRQLLLALQHVSARGVEHQDVKPENMMLYDVSVAGQQAELKLGDFGWAMPQGSGTKLPATGAGSLWYAPPELNPPVKGIKPLDEADRITGRSDMWSVGVVLYLLLVGHNPFNAALKLQNTGAIDAEVLRLVALGDFNRKAERWQKLPQEAKDFVNMMLRVQMSSRPSPAEALLHPYLTRRLAKTSESSIFFHGLVPSSSQREEAWAQLDGLQQLGWIAVARAVSEPELDRHAIACAFESVRSSDHDNATRETTYLWQLARELGTSPVTQWMQDRCCWSDVVRLAFCYLDVDSDGLLSPEDLAQHAAKPVVGSAEGETSPKAIERAATDKEAMALACHWVTRWKDSLVQDPPGPVGISVHAFRSALVATRFNDPVFEAFDAPLASGHGMYLPADISTPGVPRTGTIPALYEQEEEEISWTELSSPKHQ